MIIPAIAIVAICLGSAVHADQAAEYWQKGEELYETHNLAPDRFDKALVWYEKAITLRPNDYELLWELSKRYQIYGQALGADQKKEKLEHWKKGEAYGRRAVEANPDGKEGHFYYMANIGATAQLKGITAIHVETPEDQRGDGPDPGNRPGLSARLAGEGTVPDGNARGLRRRQSRRP